MTGEVGGEAGGQGLASQGSQENIRGQGRANEDDTRDSSQPGTDSIRGLLEHDMERWEKSLERQIATSSGTA